MRAAKPRVAKSRKTARKQIQDSPAEAQAGAAESPAWEMIDVGRYQPRRIRGSCRGRELGWTFVLPPGSGEDKSQWGNKTQWGK